MTQTIDKFLRISDVMSITGLARSTLYALVQNDQFPKPIKIGSRNSAWIASEVGEWMTTQVRISRPALPSQGGKNE